MIQFADKETSHLVRQLWELCFDDTNEFIDLFFSEKYKPENTLLYFEEGKAVAALQMLPYTITFYEETIPFSYLAGLCTLPEYRKRGYMAQLIYKAHEVIAAREIPLAILVPAENWLFAFYEKYGYEKVFEEGMKPLYPIQDILQVHQSLEGAYLQFDSIYRHKDFCVQKSLSDFRTIVKEQIMDSFPPKYNIAGMARIIDADRLLQLYAKSNTSQNVCIKIKGEGGVPSRILDVNKGSVMISENKQPDLEVGSRTLCRLLFGYKINEQETIYRKYFPAHHPVMNLMLE